MGLEDNMFRRDTAEQPAFEGLMEHEKKVLNGLISRQKSNEEILSKVQNEPDSAIKGALLRHLLNDKQQIESDLDDWLRGGDITYSPSQVKYDESGDSKADLILKQAKEMRRAAYEEMVKG